ncbi:hypothetical protein ACFLUX_01430 [Chloroflexota bacterium]
MSDRELPISFGQFLIMSIFPKLAEKSTFGKPFIRLGRVLTLSIWLYETGAILGRFWKDKIPVVFSMYEVENKREEFAQYWYNQAKNRLGKYGEQPRTFPIFVLQTDLDILMGRKLEDFMKIGEKKLSHNEGNEWLNLIETSMIEGIMFGSLYPDLTYTMLVNEYEKTDIDSWKETRKYSVTLSEEPPQMTAGDKEEEALEMVRDYVKEYHPGLLEDLSLG